MLISVKQTLSSLAVIRYDSGGRSWGAWYSCETNDPPPYFDQIMLFFACSKPKLLFFLTIFCRITRIMLNQSFDCANFDQLVCATADRLNCIYSNTTTIL